MSTRWRDAARLARRTGFGATGREVDAVVRDGAAHHVASILAADPSRDPGARATPIPELAILDKPDTKDKADPALQRYRAQSREQRELLVAWWLRRMTQVAQPFGERLTLGWHNHFATSIAKVHSAAAMAAQNEKQRRLGRGDFRALGYAMLTDPAMLRWLDGQKNSAASPNENLSREFMELFALGHADGYTENDVRAGACALTGWRLDRATGDARYLPRRHDQSRVTFLGVTGTFDTAQFLDHVLTVPGHPEYLATRWWGQLASDAAAPQALVTRAAAAYGPQRNLSALFSALLLSPEFSAATGTIVVSPIEWVVGTLRALRCPVTDSRLMRRTGQLLRQLGHLPFDPPSVGGWPHGTAWLSTAAAQLRIRAARQFVRQADLSALDGSATSRIDAVAHLLGIAGWSNGSLAVLRTHAAAPQDLVAVALNTPEYLVN